MIFIGHSIQKQEITLFSSAHGTFSRIDHTLGHKSRLGKFKKIEIISNIFSDHNTTRLDKNYMNRPITSSEIETVIKVFRETKAQDQMASQANSIKHLEKR